MLDAHEQSWTVFLKLGSREHMEQFRTGLLYMNTLRYFRDLEADLARGDRSEGIGSIIQPKDLGEAFIETNHLGMNRINIRPEDLAGPITISLNRTLNCNLFCLYAITKPARGDLFQPEHEWFGDSVVLITNTQEFMNRVSTAAKERRFQMRAEFVEYYDEKTYSGQVGLFKKSLRFGYQNEYRITVESVADGPLQFYIGDISDITSGVIPFSEANESLKFTEADAIEAGLTW